MGYIFLAGYIAFIGIASFLQKFALKDISPFQMNFLMAIGMLITAVPAVLIQQKSLSVPLKDIPLGGLVGLMMALGSIFYVFALSKLDAGVAAAISISYIIIVVILSTIFLGESLNILKVFGILLTVAGVIILSK